MRINEEYMIDNLKKFLPDEISGYYDLLHSFKSLKDEWKYSFMPDKDYMKINDPIKQANIYWSEMLYRTHIVVLVSWFKALRWLESLDNNIKNYYGFCSCLRALIESCADSFYSLRFAPLTLAKDFQAIYEILHNNSPVLLTHDPLQNVLLHYIQATKLSKEQKLVSPKEYNAKQVTEYLSSIKDGNEKIVQLYDYLCGISHPAYESTQMFLFLHKGETIVCGDSYAHESRLIESQLECFGESLLSMFRVFMGNTLTTLNTLNYFDIAEIHSELDAKAIEEHPAWTDISKNMKDSRSRYLYALQSGVYN